MNDRMAAAPSALSPRARLLAGGIAAGPPGRSGSSVRAARRAGCPLAMWCVPADPGGARPDRRAARRKEAVRATEEA
jgi:hypothetical protein